MEILTHINKNILSLSKTQRKVAHYILANWEKVCYQSAISIANELGVSQSSVVRTATQLGFPSFGEFQDELRNLVSSRVSIINLMDKANLVKNGKESADILKAVFELHEENLRITLRNLDPEQVKRAALTMNSAEQIFILGMRSSAGVANHLGFQLSMIRRKVRIMDSNYTLAEYLKELSVQDVIVGISFSRYTKETLNALTIARQAGAFVITITDAATSPLIGLSDIPFIVSVTSPHFNNSYLPTMGLIDVLLTMMTAENKDNSLKELKLVDKLLQQMHTF